MNESSRLLFVNYSAEVFFSLLEFRSIQASYLERYLDALNAKVILRESKYFDRDYLAEFAAFYSVSAKGYPNVCERLHFFSDDVSRRILRAAASGSSRAKLRMQNAYLGFVVRRPIPAARLGRTVLKWFPDKFVDTTPRVPASTRKYVVHICGIELYVEGLAWQQQDTGVGACATVSLWSMLHSSALDEYHAIPTTADITRDAHKKHSFGTRIFPSKGLNIYQIDDAIKEQNLVPLVADGDIKDERGNPKGFSRDRFSSTCASYIRSGYPVLMLGELNTSDGVAGHAICNVGFRSCVPPSGDASTPLLADSNIEIFYVHDDNLGPNVRFRVTANAANIAVISPEAPIEPNGRSVETSPTDNYGTFVPTQLIVAAHSDIRTDPDTLHRIALTHVSDIAGVINRLAESIGRDPLSFVVSSRITRMTDYVGNELYDRLKGSSDKEKRILASVRLALSETVSPMSLHIAVVRVGLDDATVFADFLYDTTDSDRNQPVFAHVAYHKVAAFVIDALQKANGTNCGVCVVAY